MTTSYEAAGTCKGNASQPIEGNHMRQSRRTGDCKQTFFAPVCSCAFHCIDDQTLIDMRRSIFLTGKMDCIAFLWVPPVVVSLLS